MIASISLFMLLAFPGILFSLPKDSISSLDVSPISESLKTIRHEFNRQPVTFENHQVWRIKVENEQQSQLLTELSEVRVIVALFFKN